MCDNRRQIFLSSSIYCGDPGLSAIARVFADRPRDSIIADVMCGCGHVGKRLAAMGFNPLFIDIDPQNIELLSNEHDVKVGDVRQLPYEEGTFDACFIRYGLHNLSLSDQGVALSEVFRVLRPNGLFVLADVMPRPEDQSYLNAIDNQKNIHSGQTPCSFFHTSGELLECLQTIGFDEVNIVGDEILETRLSIWPDSGFISADGANDIATMLKSLPQRIIDAFNVRVDAKDVLFSLPVACAFIRSRSLTSIPASFNALSIVFATISPSGLVVVSE